MTVIRVFHCATLALALVSTTGRAQLTVTSGSIIEKEAKPGESYASSIVIKNAANVAIVARLSIADYSFTADGNSHLDSAGALPRSNARWIRDLPTSITVPPNGVASARFVVRVPVRTDSLGGTYWSIVLVEAVEPARGAVSPVIAVKRPAVGVQTQTRFGVQVATNLPALGESRVEFRNPRAERNPAKETFFEFDLKNAGDRGVRPMITLELYDVAGKLVTRGKEQRGLIYPGTGIRQRFALGAVPTGTYTAMLLADGGGAEVFATQLQIKF